MQEVLFVGTIAFRHYKAQKVRLIVGKLNGKMINQYLIAYCQKKPDLAVWMQIWEELI